MTLGEKQALFTSKVPELINLINSLGFRARIAFVKRCEACPVGHPLSCHKFCCAIDINIDEFKDGKWAWIEDGSHHIWKVLADFWKALHPDFRAGYDFNDSNHFSITYNGVS